MFPAPLPVLPAGQDGWCAATPGVLVESLEVGVGLDKWLIDEGEALQLGGYRQPGSGTRSIDLVC